MLVAVNNIDSILRWFIPDKKNWRHIQICHQICSTPQQRSFDFLGTFLPLSLVFQMDVLDVGNERARALMTSIERCCWHIIRLVTNSTTSLIYFMMTWLRKNRFESNRLTWWWSGSKGNKFLESHWQPIRYWNYSRANWPISFHVTFLYISCIILYLFL